MTNKNRPKVIVRDGTVDDLEFIVECNCRLGLETEDKTLDRGVLTDGVRRGMSSPQMCRYFIAEADGKPVGMTMVTFELTDWRDGVIWWLQSVYVMPDFRNFGIFRRVYYHIAELAKNSDDVRALRLYVLTDNHRAVKTYEAMGMSHAGYEVLEDDWSL